MQSSYEETLQYLYERLPMFSRTGKDAIKKDLTNIRKLCTALDDPQKKFPSIHIAGTNGKGSTSHMLAAVLQDAGYKTGLYTSPHITDFRERIRINGVPVKESWVVNFVRSKKELIESVEPSFFEVTVAMAFQAFAEEDVDMAVIETGLGGRLDSTNIIEPVLSIITNISYDHKDVLGNTLQEIAKEKAGIIKEQVPVLIGEQREETARIFFETALRNQSTVYYAQSVWDLVRVKQERHFQYFKAVHKAHGEIYDLKTDLLGRYQSHNIKTVLAATEVLIASRGLNLTIGGAIKALARVKKLTGLRGRWECLQEQPLIIADVGHNPAGLAEVFDQWKQVKARQKHILIGFVKDKDVEEALKCLPADGNYHFCQARIPRALPATELLGMAEKRGLKGAAYSSVEEALKNVRSGLRENDALLITGSFFITGEAIDFLNEEKREPAAG